MSAAKLTLSRLENLLMTACDEIRAEDYNCNIRRYVDNAPPPDPSRMEWVVDGLQDLRSFLVSNAVRSIALPALGAGLGGLPWAVVRGHIEAALGDFPVDAWVYEPL